MVLKFKISKKEIKQLKKIIKILALLVIFNM